MTHSYGSQGSEIETSLFLRSLGLGRATGSAASALARAIKPLSVRAGTVLYEAGSPSTFIDYVVRGTVELRAPGAPGWRFGALDTLGVHDLFLGRSRLRTAVAETDVDLFRIGCDDYRDVLEDDHDFTRALISTVGAGLSTMNAGISTRPLQAPRTLLDRVNLLKRCPAFARARVQSLVDLAGALVEATVAKGEILAEEGESAPRLTIVAGGAAELEAREGSPPIRYANAMLIGGYDSLAERAAGPSSASVTPATAETSASERPRPPRDERPAARVVEDAILLHLDEEYLYAVVDDHFDLAWSLLGAIAAERELARNTAAPPPPVAP